MADTTQIPVCRTRNCVNRQTTIGARGAEVLPHPIRPDCHPDGTPVGSGQVAQVRPLRDDPITTNADGGSQSVIAETFTTLPLRALRAIAQLQRLGDEKYGAHNWRKISEVDHLDHAFAHLLGYCQLDPTEDHLLHATWRLLAALEQHLTEVEKTPND